MRTVADVTRLMTMSIADLLDDWFESPQVKGALAVNGEMAGRVADRAVQVFVGRGDMRENVAERFYRELRVERIWEGTSEVQRVIIAGQLARRGLRALV